MIRSLMDRSLINGLLLLVFCWCMSAQAERFDHQTTEFPFKGQHQVLDCESCHVNGLFKGTPTECKMCHSDGGIVDASTKTIDHVLTNDQCADCHTTDDWSTIIRFEHQSVSGSCASCHNNTITGGKSADHIATTQQCDTCHLSTSWLPATFDHADVTAGIPHKVGISPFTTTAETTPGNTEARWNVTSATPPLTK
jgi:hypothetical protein